jgi:hypothetical protein
MLQVNKVVLELQMVEQLVATEQGMAEILYLDMVENNKTTEHKLLVLAMVRVVAEEYPQAVQIKLEQRGQ